MPTTTGERLTIDAELEMAEGRLVDDVAGGAGGRAAASKAAASSSSRRPPSATAAPLRQAGIPAVARDGRCDVPADQACHLAGKIAAGHRHGRRRRRRPEVRPSRRPPRCRRPRPPCLPLRSRKTGRTPSGWMRAGLVHSAAWTRPASMMVLISERQEPQLVPARTRAPICLDGVAARRDGRGKLVDADVEAGADDAPDRRHRDRRAAGQQRQAVGDRQRLARGQQRHQPVARRQLAGRRRPAALRPSRRFHRPRRRGKFRPRRSVYSSNWSRRNGIEQLASQQDALVGRLGAAEFVDPAAVDRAPAPVDEAGRPEVAPRDQHARPGRRPRAQCAQAHVSVPAGRRTDR